VKTKAKGVNLMHDNNGLWNEIQGNWRQFTGSIQKRWGDFTEDEILEMQGERRKLIGLIQERYGIAQQEAERQVDEWADMALTRF
jgi:uncharacterized protein YjbJ (UPF0337 family)